MDFIYHLKCKCGEYLRKKQYNKRRVNSFEMSCQFCNEISKVNDSEFIEDDIGKDSKGITQTHLKHQSIK